MPGFLPGPGSYAELGLGGVPAAQVAGGIPYYQAVLADQPLSYWRLGEPSGTAAVDVMGLHNGTYSTSPTLGAASLLSTDADTAMSCSGADTEGMYHPSNPADYKIPTGTLEAWVKTSDTAAARSLALYRSKYGIFIWGGIASGYEWAGSTGQKSSGANVADGVRHHIVLVFQDGVTNGSQIYVDGVARGTPWTHTSASVSPEAFSAGFNATAGQGLTAVIDEVALYTSTLSVARILAHYNAGTVVVAATTPQTLTATTLLVTASMVRQANAIRTATNVLGTGSMVRLVNATRTATTVVATGSRTLQVNKPLTATSSAVTASMVAMKVILKALTATAVAVTASMVRQMGKPLSATVVATASMVRQVNKLLTATTVVVTATQTAIKVILRTLTATSVLVTGSMVRQTNKLLTAAAVAASATISRLLSYARTLAATSTVTASIQKQVGKTLTATTVAATAALAGIKVILKTLTATTVLVTATVVRQARTTLQATTVALTALIVKQVGKTLRATNVAVTASQSALRVFLRALTATTVVVTATAVRQTLKILPVTVAVTGAATKRMTHTLVAAPVAAVALMTAVWSGVTTIYTTFFARPTPAANELDGVIASVELDGQPDQRELVGALDDHGFHPPSPRRNS